MALRYAIGDYTFHPEEFFPRELFDRITDTRVTRPEVVAEEAQARRRRPRLTRDGRLTILAADHPARMVTAVGDDPLAMGNRWTLLARILRVITAEEFDGVMTTPDIMEDLFIVHRLDKELGGPGFLDQKVLLGCMNRGGLSGAAFELDDRMTAFTPEMIAARRLDGAKVMFRLEPREPASLDTMMYCVEAINACQARGIPVFLEALMVEHVDGKYKTLKNAEALIKVVSVASGLGSASALTWLKIPYCEGFERVAEATTCPILMLGGESRGDPTGILLEFAAGMRAGGTVRGALVGRNVTFPGRDDPLAVALAVDAIVHRGFSAEEAAAYLAEVRGRGMDRFTRWLSR
ncbi:MAG: hypothetical protein QN141_13595 [Armatimonadota bacterium]|nr:hypothetical protein [Armatimonadota bacterium]MDR7494295.1 hypothetical protein [Armatimonadota bacterium]MDR7500522.1 hypothetical protein [Armatimonadota bacterium]MDR7548016.1 hypothetical protein [Armatimonadota bacterium]MDR7553679.1 hypothetical protein [Armatimonadota bacterium]